MASLSEMMAYADYARRQKELKDPLRLLVESFSGGLNEGLKRRADLEDYRRQKQIDTQEALARSGQELDIFRQQKQIEDEIDRAAQAEKLKGMMSLFQMQQGAEEQAREAEFIRAQKLEAQKARLAEHTKLSALNAANRMNLDRRRQALESLSSTGTDLSSGSKLQGLLSSKNLKMEPKFDLVSGKMDMTIREKTPDEMFLDVTKSMMNGEITEDQAKQIMPTRSKEIEEIVDLSAPGSFVGGTKIPSQAAPGPVGQIQAGQYQATKLDPRGRVKEWSLPSVEQQKFEKENKEDLEAKQKAFQAERAMAEDIKFTISELKKNLKYFGAGSHIPALWTEYDKQAWEANYSHLVENLRLDKLTQLKNASKTGASGLGPVSEKEFASLLGAATSLRKGLNEEKALEYLNIIEEKMDKMLTNSSSGVGVSGGGFQEGKIYIDPSSGIRALYQGGQWLNPETLSPLETVAP